jgi:hypothetical protein
VDYLSFYHSRYGYTIICDLFIHRIIDVLEIGKSEYLQTPLSFAWGLIEHISSARGLSSTTVSRQPSSFDVRKDLFILRTLHLLYLRSHLPPHSLIDSLFCGRYQSELSDIPMNCLCQLFCFGISLQTGTSLSCDAQWIHHCVNIFTIRLSNSSQRRLADFVSSGCVDLLLDLLSSNSLMANILHYQEEKEDEDDDSDLENEEECHSVPLSNPSLPSPEDRPSRKMSIYRSRRSSNAKSAHVVNRLQSGETVVMNLTSLLFTLSHESNFCSTYLGSSTPSVLSLVPNTTAAADGVAHPSSMEKLFRAVWLVSCHGPNRPHSLNVPLEKLLHTIMRLLHSSPLSLYPTLLSHPHFLRILLATGVTPTGEGILLSTTVDLIADILLSIPFYLPPVPQQQQEQQQQVDSAQIAKQMVKDRLSLRQMILSEKRDFSSSPRSKSPNSLLNLLGSDVLINTSSHTTLRPLPLPHVMDEITSILPYQLAAFIYQLPSTVFCSQVFNVPSSIIKPDIIWNTNLRQDLIVSLYQELSDWHLSSFQYPIGLTDVLNLSSVKFISLRCEPQLSGIYLTHLIKLTNPLEFMCPLETRGFSKDLLRTLQATLGIVRRNSLSATRRDSKTLYETKNPHQGVNDSFFEMVPERQSSYLLLSLSKVIELLSFPEDVWYDDALPTLSNHAEFYSRIIIEGFNQMATKPSSAASTPIAFIELPTVEAYICSILCLLQSLFPAHFLRDEGKKTSQLISMQQRMLSTRVGVFGPLVLHKHCQTMMSSMKLSLRYWRRKQGTALVSPPLDQYFSLSLSLSTLFLLQLASHCYEAIYPSTPSLSFGGDREERKSSGRSNLLLDESPIRPPPPHGVPTEIMLCLRSLFETDILGQEVMTCLSLHIASVAPHATLQTLISLRLFVLMNTEYQSRLLDLILSRGLLISILDLITSLLSADDLTASSITFSSKEFTFAHHPALLSFDKFSEKIPLPLNRRRGSLQNSLSLPPPPPESFQRARSNSGGNMLSLAVHGPPDLTYYPSIDDACRDVLERCSEIVKTSILSSNKDTLPCSPLQAPVPSLSTIPNLESLHKVIVCEAILLIRSIVSVATVLHNSSLPPPQPLMPSSSSAISSRQSPRNKSSTSTQYQHAILSLLEYALTPSLLHVLLHNLSLFVEIFRSNKLIKRPLAIWSPAMMSLLKEYLRNQMARLETAGGVEQESEDGLLNSYATIPPHSSSPSSPSQVNLFDKDSFKSLYPMLSDEILIDGVFITLLLDPQNRDDIGARNLPDFVEQLQASISSSKRVLELVQQQQQQRRQSVSKASLVSQVAIKQQVLNHILREHPELGYSDLYVTD